MTKEMLEALEEIEAEKGISREIMGKALEAALVSAYRKHYGMAYNVEAQFDAKTGGYRLFAEKKVVEEVADALQEIELPAAQALHPESAIAMGDIVKVEASVDGFGRIAAQTALQVVVQRMREAERTMLLDEYGSKVGEMINGIVSRVVHNNVFVNIGKLEALLPRREQAQGETYHTGDRIKLVILDVKPSPRGPRVLVSRADGALIKRLFELEVPEVFEKVVELKGIAREAGVRTKIAVHSTVANVDPLGACVGARSSRIQAIVRDLGGEKIDIVIWHEASDQFIKNALSPAKVRKVLLNETSRVATVLVADDQLALAIGKKGQNARLAAKLTGWKIDISRESEHQAKAETAARIEAQKLFTRPPVAEGEEDQAGAASVRDITQIKGVGAKLAEKLRLAGFGSLESLRSATKEDICAVPGVGAKTAEKILAAIATLEE